MDSEVILIDSDSDGDNGNLNEGTETGFFVVSKQEQLDEPVETVSQSSSISLPDLAHCNFEVSVSDSVAAIPAVTAPATEPEKLRIGYISRSPILQKFMKTSLLFEEKTASDKCSALGMNSGLKANLNTVFDSDCGVSTVERDILSGCVSNENSDIVRLSCGISNASLGMGRVTQHVLSGNSNRDANLSATERVFVDDPMKNSVADAAVKMQLKEVGKETSDFEASELCNKMPSSNIKDASEDESGGDDDEDLPCFLDVHQMSKKVKQSLKIKCEKDLEEESMEIGDEAVVEVYPMQKIASYSIDQLLADHKETERLRAMVVDLQTEPYTLNESPSRN